ncbi:hypothetical protein BH24CHL1_BH24CHL1_09110 [soil metagenome]
MNSCQARGLVGIGIVIIITTACGETELPTTQSGAEVNSTPTMLGEIYRETVLPDETPEIAPETPVYLAPTPSQDAAPENTIESSSCSVGASSSTISVSSPEILAWIADQVVIGTIIEQLPSEFGRELYPQGPRAIHTDFAFEVKVRVRGESHDIIYIRQPGGAIGDCVVAHEDTLVFKIGDQLLLFLYDDKDDRRPTYGVLGGGQGYWEIQSDGRVEPLWLEVLSSSGVESGGIQLTDLVERLHASLISGSPPQQPGSTLATPLDVSPVVAEVPDVSSILEQLPPAKP